jgi:peroxiredoxin
MYQVWLFIAVGATAVAASTDRTFPLLDDCSNTSDVVAKLSESDSVRVRYSLGGSPETCYAVAATFDGKNVEGFVLGTGHPAIASFESEARTHIREVPAPPKPDPESTLRPDKPAPPPPPVGPSSFAGLRAVDMRGRRVDLDSIRSPYVVLYFFSGSDKKLMRDSEGLEQFYNQYHKKGYELVGVGSNSGKAGMQAYAQEVEAVWPLVQDRGEITSRYKVNPQTPYYVLDQHRNVIATAKRANDILPELQRMGKLPR